MKSSSRGSVVPAYAWVPLVAVFPVPAVLPLRLSASVLAFFALIVRLTFPREIVIPWFCCPCLRLGSPCGRGATTSIESEMCPAGALP